MGSTDYVVTFCSNPWLQFWCSGLKVLANQGALVQVHSVKPVTVKGLFFLTANKIKMGMCSTYYLSL